MTFHDILAKYRAISFSERDKGDRFERLMQAFLLTVPWYEGKFRHVWLWREFPYKENIGGKDTVLILLLRLWKAISGPFNASAMTKRPESTRPLWTVFWLRPVSSSLMMNTGRPLLPCGSGLPPPITGATRRKTPSVTTKIIF